MFLAALVMTHLSNLSVALFLSTQHVHSALCMPAHHITPIRAPENHGPYTRLSDTWTAQHLLHRLSFLLLLKWFGYTNQRLLIFS